MVPGVRHGDGGLESLLQEPRAPPLARHRLLRPAGHGQRCQRGALQVGLGVDTGGREVRQPILPLRQPEFVAVIGSRATRAST